MRTPPPHPDSGDSSQIRELVDLLAGWGAPAEEPDGAIYRAIRAVEDAIVEKARLAFHALARLHEVSGASLPEKLKARLESLVARGRDRPDALDAAFVRDADDFFEELGPSIDAACESAARESRSALLRAGELAPDAERKEVLSVLWRAEEPHDAGARAGLLAEFAKAQALCDVWPEVWSRELRASLDDLDRGAPDLARRARAALDSGRPDALASALRDVRVQRGRALASDADPEKLATARTRLGRALQQATGSDGVPLSAHLLEEARAALDARLRGAGGARGLDAWTAALELASSAPRDPRELEARLARLRDLSTPAVPVSPLADEAEALERRLLESAADLPVSFIVGARHAIEAARACGVAADESAVESLRLELASQTRRVEACAKHVKELRAHTSEVERRALDEILEALDALADPRIRSATESVRRRLAEGGGASLAGVADDIRGDLAPATRRLHERANALVGAARQGIEQGRAEIKAPLDALLDAARRSDAVALARRVAQLAKSLGPQKTARAPIWAWALACLPLALLPLVALVGSGSVRPLAVVLATSAIPDEEIRVDLVDARGEAQRFALTPAQPETRAELLPGRYSVITNGTYSGVSFGVPGSERVEIPLAPAGGR